MPTSVAKRCSALAVTSRPSIPRTRRYAWPTTPITASRARSGRPDRAREAVIGVVGQAYRLVLGIEGRDVTARAEHLFATDVGIGANPRPDRRFDEEAAGGGARQRGHAAAGHDGGA